jgi:hypothetical protein
MNYVKYSEISCLNDEHLLSLLRIGVTYVILLQILKDWLKKNKLEFHINLFLLNILNSNIFIFLLKL